MSDEKKLNLPPHLLEEIGKVMNNPISLTEVKLNASGDMVASIAGFKSEIHTLVLSTKHVNCKSVTPTYMHEEGVTLVIPSGAIGETGDEITLMVINTKTLKSCMSVVIPVGQE